MRIPKMITVRQPWASLSVYGYVDNSGSLAFKDVENRSWAPRYQGRLLIHAGQRVDHEGLDLMENLGITLAGPMHHGVILGSVDVGEIIRSSPSVWAEEGMFHWVQTNPTPARRLLEVTGFQGLRDAPADWGRAFTAADLSPVGMRLSRVRAAEAPAMELLQRPSSPADRLTDLLRGL
ncbi:hypothetical protein ACIBKY_51015 [Nonomuraea sp. NPDC050394]|uniref:hypothetical protein n=1 Tax=Nonomuraea sp. NPDC050394 TaxID=3364363 RepID=UPI0037ABAC9B